MDDSNKMVHSAKLILVLLILLVSVPFSYAADIPIDDRDLFSHLFAGKAIPAEWISPPVNEELTPAMMAEIATRLSKNGGPYQEASKSAKGWVLAFENGTARARIVRATDNKLIGVFFSKLE